MAKQPSNLLVLTTCPGSTTAKRIANDLVMEKLAACVQIIPGVQSFFCWAGRMDNAAELLLLIKTTSDRYKALENRIKVLHPYELPEVISVTISGGLERYLDWIDTNTQV